MDYRSSSVGDARNLAVVHVRNNPPSIMVTHHYQDTDGEPVNNCTCSSSSSSNTSSSCGRLRRRQLRTAVRDGDVQLLQRLLRQMCRGSGNSAVSDDVINISVSETFSYSLLTLAVRCGHLDVVDALVSTSQCDVDRLGRTGLSALDEALAAWFRGLEQAHTRQLGTDSPAVGNDVECSRRKTSEVSVCLSNSSARVRHDNARRYRIVRRLLNVGASHVSPEALDKLVTAADSRGVSGRTDLWSLVKVICEQGRLNIRSTLLAVLAWYRDTAAMLNMLMKCSADPIYLIPAGQPFSQFAMFNVQRPLPLDNATILVRGCSDLRLLNFVDSTISGELIQNTFTEPVLPHVIDDRLLRSTPSSTWPEYRVLVELLTLSGHRIGLNVLNLLYKRHAALYRWVVEHGGCGSVLRRRPTSLLHAARLAVRRHLSPNVTAALPTLAGILPHSLRDFLLFSDISASSTSSY